MMYYRAPANHVVPNHAENFAGLVARFTADVINDRDLGEPYRDGYGGDHAEHFVCGEDGHLLHRLYGADRQDLEYAFDEAYRVAYGMVR